MTTKNNPNTVVAKTKKEHKAKKAPKNSNTVNKQASMFFMLLTVIFAGLAIVTNVFYSDLALFYRVLVILVLLAIAFVCFLQTTLGKATVLLAQGSRFELRKVIWPTRSETLQTAGMVFVFVIIVGLILWLADSIFIAIIDLILG